ncbi:PTS transporter subunit EIIC [Spiroplasma diminutum]|uniref:PTS system N-acetylglucosamine-specific IIBC component n=1 Tax=Spiroplasma diminutum CUAS-1 TaxID=1276221 RepID=S5MDV8_9MOLU|nr:PTS transporter subunit EIIC [Spiroplasma diminutum]AGR41903.1 PTS system N-acetylglucosamine-specific IIBC component [Spiroplasma diminutum CUAS-1]
MSEKSVHLTNEKKLKTKQIKNSDSSNNGWSKFLTMLQELGKVLQFPIAVLPFAAILNRFGALGIELSTTDGEITNQIGYWISLIIQKPGSIPFDNLALLFAIGCAFGLAKDHRGEVALVAVIFYLSITALTGEGTLPEMIYGKVLPMKQTGEVTIVDGKEVITELAGNAKQWSQLLYVPIMKFTTESREKVIVGAAYVLNIGVLGGIVAGCMSAWFYNKFKDIKLPTALSFFGGRRFVPMVALVASIPTAFAFAIVWPWIQLGLIKFGTSVANPENPALAIPGTTIYSILNRLLLPFGLHQIMNTFFWFQMPVTGYAVAPISGVPGTELITVNGDINAFTAGISNAGLFQSGFFPIMMGGLPMAAVAMIFTADKENRKEMAGFLGGVAGVAFLSGITEPLEFSFVFIAPVLLGVHAGLTGIFMAITTAMKIQIGFGFSAGFIDYAISFAQSWGLANYHNSVLANPLWILALVAIAGGVYFVVFYFTIKGMNLATPGRNVGGVINTAGKTSSSKESTQKGDKYENMASKIVDAIGRDNFVSIDNCATRLRLVLKDNSKIDDSLIKSAGTYGIKRLGTESLQIVIGPDVEHAANALRKELEK